MSFADGKQEDHIRDMWPKFFLEQNMLVVSAYSAVYLEMVAGQDI